MKAYVNMLKIIPAPELKNLAFCIIYTWLDASNGKLRKWLMKKYACFAIATYWIFWREKKKVKCFSCTLICLAYFCRYSPFLMACYNPETEEYQSVCRVMSGFSDSFYIEVKMVDFLLVFIMIPFCAR